MWIAIYILESGTKTGVFDNKQFSYNGSIVIAIFSVIIWIFIAVIGSLIQGFFISNKIKLTVLLLIMIVNLIIAIQHFFRNNFDVQIKIWSQNVSMRSFIIAKALENCLWFSTQFYETVRHPNQIKLLSKN